MKTLQQMVVLVSLVAGPLVACSSTPTRESTGEYIDDSAISNKIRAQLIGDKDLNLFQIDVTTYKGVVQLSGFVNSAPIKARAGRVAAGTQGVREVHNNLIVK
jgi:osmotically-inducible protein OsmY